jgi:CBS domain-containing protein
MPQRAQKSDSALYQLAGDLMSSPVVSVRSSDSVSEAARLMLDAGVGGVPVLDAAGVAVGMASDGDLLGRRGEDARVAWWLKLLAEGESSGALRKANADRLVGEVMSAPLITISPRAPVQEIAEVMQAHRIKRLPVLDAGRLVGIVSRSDLLCVVESVPLSTGKEGEIGGSGLLGFLESLIGGASLRGAIDRSAASHSGGGPAKGATAPRPLSASAFREAVQAYKAETVDLKESLNREAQLERRRQIKALLDHHVSNELWRELLDHAELAARSGERELMMLRFPSDLCSDGGRKIDVVEEGWEATLRGEAAELYARWKAELKPQGFGLSARIVSYEDGIIGDLGLYLTWGGV